MQLKAFKATVLFFSKLQLTDESPAIVATLSRDYLVVATSKEEGIDKLTELLERSTKNPGKEPYPFQHSTRIIEITILEWDGFLDKWDLFFHWKAGGTPMPLYDMETMQNIYRKHRDEQGHFANWL